MRLAGALLAGALAILPAVDAAAQGTNLGMVALTSVHGRFLQADSDGELHAGAAQRGEEETWFLIEVDRARHIYVLQNWRTGKFLGKVDVDCAEAANANAGAAEAWQLVPGADFGVLDALALRSVADGTFLGANSPGSVSACGGEVAAGSGAAPPRGIATWPGWWTFRAASAPGAGSKPWNAKGRPADLSALFASLL